MPIDYGPPTALMRGVGLLAAGRGARHGPGRARGCIGCRKRRDTQHADARV